MGCLAIWLSAFSACTGPRPTQFLPKARELGSPRGYQLARTITHFHSPYSFDACDKEGLREGVVNASCYAHLVDAMCKNRVDFLFLSDHPDHLQDYSMLDLIHAETSDEVLYSGAGDPYAKKVGSCEDGFEPTFLIGFEATAMMAFGMTKHLEETPSARSEAYQDDTGVLRNRLQTEADALVVIPHTESKDVSWIESVSPDGIEIYNFHANIDPKIRKTHLGVRPFDKFAGFLTYLFDPFGQLVPDLGFLQFVETFPAYFTKWNALIANGVHVTGLAGSDSHENVFPQKVSDSERLDSHRRVARIVSNHFLVSSLEVSDIKDAIRNARGWVVFEGLGSPVGFDFYATVGQQIVGVGESGSLGGSSAEVRVNLPTLHPDSPQDAELPVVSIVLKKVLSEGEDVVLAQTLGESLVHVVSEAGAYRAELSITPKHLRKYLGDFATLADQPYPWIITNHLYLTL